MKLGKNELFNCEGSLYLIPDIHGEYDKLNALWDKIQKELKEEDHLIFLGDYIGLLSRKNIYTLQLIQKIKDTHKNTFCLKGNHEESFLDFLKNPSYKFFLDIDGLSEEILELGYPKFNKETIQNILKERNITFLDNLLPYYESESVIITHAPLNPDISIFRSIDEGLLDEMSFDLLWEFINPDEENTPVKGIDKWLICGHQNNGAKDMVPRNEPSIYQESKRIFLDCGVGYRKESKLYCLKFPWRTYFSHEDNESKVLSNSSPVKESP